MSSHRELVWEGVDKEWTENGKRGELFWGNTELVKSRLCHKATFSRLTTCLQGTCVSECVSVRACVRSGRSMGEMRDYGWVMLRTDIGWPQVLLHICLSGSAFHIWVTPVAFRSRRKDKSRAIRQRGLTRGATLCGTRQSNIWAVKVSHKHEAAGSGTGSWRGRNKG